MATKQFATAALRHLQNYASRANELGSSPRQLVIELNLGFQVSLSNKLFRVVQPLLQSLQRSHRCIQLEPSIQGRNFALIKLQDSACDPRNKVSARRMFLCAVL